MANEMPPKAMLNYVAEQIGADPTSFDLYARREETRMNHVAHLLSYLEMRSPTAEDRRAALLAAIETASTTDKGAAIANTIIDVPGAPGSAAGGEHDRTHGLGSARDCPPPC
jgi:hypothetical protein